MPLNDRVSNAPGARDGKPASSVGSVAEAASRIEERHYSVADLAERWNLSSDTIRKLFENEAGVLVLGESSVARGKRRYTTLRVPESVAVRVHRRLSKV